MGLRTALVVDDSRSARYALQCLLERQSIHVDTVDSAQQALSYLREHRPDVVFMDDLMPGMDGLEAIDRLSADPVTACIPIVMYTGREDRVSLDQARRRGVIDILSKPFTDGDVRTVLERLGHTPEPPMVARLVRAAQDAVPAVTAEAAPESEPESEPMAEPEPSLARVFTDEAVEEVFAALREAGASGFADIEDADEIAADLSGVAVATAPPVTDSAVLSHEQSLIDTHLEKLRAELIQAVKSETRFAIAQLVGEALEQQVAEQIRSREETWRRALEGVRGDSERFQVQLLEERMPRLLDRIEQRVEQRLQAAQKVFNERLEGGALTTLQRATVAHIARTEASEAAHRPARQSARRVAAEFIRGDLVAMNQRFERLRQRFNFIIVLGVTIMIAASVLAYLASVR